MKENLAAITTVRLTHGEIATLGSAPQDTCAMDPNFYGEPPRTGSASS